MRELLLHNTICSATEQRQAAAITMASSVDAVVVVGGRNSANTRRLAELCKDRQPRTFHVESAAELDPEHVPTRVAFADLDLAGGNLAAARAGLADALELAPADVDARAAFAELLAAEGDRRGCEERARQLRGEAPREPRVQALAERCAAAGSVVSTTKTEAP